MVAPDTISGTSLARPRRALIAALLILFAELAVIGGVFKHGIAFTCLANWPQWACSGASGAMVALYCVAGALVLMAMLIPQPFHELTQAAGRRIWPLGLNLAGVVVALLPVLFMKEMSGTQALTKAFACWIIGMGAILIGLALFIAPFYRWAGFIRETWHHLIPVLGAGLAAPWLATQIRPLWRLDSIANVTFEVVAVAIKGLGYEVKAFAAEKVIGADEFYISVAPQCSGVEGFALVTLFVTLYLWLFRAELRFPIALLLYPLGLAASAVFNVVRITVLLAIGLSGNPELAVGGFHSHAGWLMFTLVALGLIALARTIPVLQKTSAGSDVVTQPLPPLRCDPAAARILPFAIFMFSALLANVFSQSPAVVYPARVMLMIGVLAFFWPIYARLPWRIDPLALAVGAAIGLLWGLIPASANPDVAQAVAPYGALSGLALLGWFFCRGVGTILLVPLIEELFFRDYLTAKLMRAPGTIWKIAAALATAALFAALHDRWAEAFAAGLAFSWLAQRRGNIADAILAHALANAIVFAIAVLSGNLSII